MNSATRHTLKMGNIRRYDAKVKEFESDLKRQLEKYNGAPSGSLEHLAIHGDVEEYLIKLEAPLKYISMSYTVQSSAAEKSDG